MIARAETLTLFAVPGVASIAIANLQLSGTLQDAYDYLSKRFRVRGAAFAVGEEQMGRPDEGVRERWDIGRASQAAKCLFRAEVRGDRCGPFRYQREAGGTCLAQACTQAVAGDDQRRYRHRQWAEHCGQRLGEVVSNNARACGSAKCGHRAGELGDAIEHELGEEGIEIDEVAVHHALCHGRFRSDSAAGQPGHTVSAQHALGRVKKQFSSVEEVNAGRHWSFPPGR